jgi:hypothetical protein
MVKSARQIKGVQIGGTENYGKKNKTRLEAMLLALTTSLHRPPVALFVESGA